MRNEVTIQTEYITLAALLKFCGAVMTGGEAGSLIREGQVLVNGEPCTMRGKKIYPGDTICIGSQTVSVL